MTEKTKPVFYGGGDVVFVSVDHVRPITSECEDVPNNLMVVVSHHRAPISEMWKLEDAADFTLHSHVKTVSYDEAIERILAQAATAPSPLSVPRPSLAPITTARGFGALLKLLTPHSTFKQVVTPQLVDLCDAHAEALANGRPGLARWIVIRESVAIIWRLCKWPLIALIELIKEYLDLP